MIWIAVYVAVGIATSLYLPWRIAKSKKKLEQLPSRELADGDPVFAAAAKSVQADYRLWHFIVGGLLWPTQVVAYIVAEYLLWRRGL